MRFSDTLLCWTVFGTLALSTSMQAQSKDSDGAQDSCRLFVQDFYDWYLPNTHVKQAKINGMPALEFALKSRRYAFDSELARQLDEVRAQEKRDREPLLDFDPVLNNQDPASHYAVEKTELKDGRCRADVYGEWRVLKKSEKPSVVAELTFRNGQWLFTDFWYPDSEHPDSKSLLRMLHEHTASRTTAQEDPLRRFLQNYVGSPESNEGKATRYFAAFVHLRDDNMQQAIVYLMNGGWCGSGGCTTLILEPKGSTYRLITKIMTTRVPIRLLSTKTNGWHDLAVCVQGGGITNAYEARLPFNGKSYPTSPSAPAAQRLTSELAGEVIVPASTVGEPLYP